MPYMDTFRYIYDIFRCRALQSQRFLSYVRGMLHLQPRIGQIQLSISVLAKYRQVSVKYR